MQASLKDIIEWDVLNWAEALRIWQPIIDSLPRDSNILAIGERNGGLSLWLALQGFRVICTDRIGPTEEAIKMHQKYGVQELIEYRSFDIFNPDIPENTIDLVIMKSVLGGLKSNYQDKSSRNDDARKSAIDNIYGLLKTDGYLLTADNMQGSVPIQWLRNRHNKQAGWHYFSFSEMDTLMTLFTSSSTRAFGVLPTSFSNQALNALSHFTNKHLLQWLQASDKYIGITIARK